MKKFFQKEWYEIPFDTFTSCNPEQLPDEAFYQQFYKEFFAKYQNWEDLKPNWIQNKAKLGKLVLDRIPWGSKTLSIGCGIGLMEKFLYASGLKNLEIHEVDEAPLTWTKQIFPSEAIHVETSLENISPDISYDYIYMSKLDYCFNEPDWINFLKIAKTKLNLNGCCLVISSSIQRPFYHWSEISLFVIYKIKAILSLLGVYHPGQFWGLRRTSGEHRRAMTQAGFLNLQDGYWRSDNPKNSWVYWLEGSLIKKV